MMLMSWAPILAPGKNALGILLGNGIQNDFGSYVWDFVKARFRGAPQTAFSLEIEYENGKRSLFLPPNKR